ncbi:MAG: alkaline phosphatase family protein [Natrialbaceae archaeon]|nr:alkaline phosphatase family protein [Natrialbaceae archaeon]
MSDSTSTVQQAFVLGLDGVPWQLIDRWAAAGELPNFAQLMSDGATGPLESTRPPTTPLAWPSIATGVWPDKHGIYGFQNLSEEYTHRMYTSQDLRQPPMWEQVDPAVVGNVPLTYPARQIEGEMVTGMMTPTRDTGFTHPPDLDDHIKSEIPDYVISIDYPNYVDDLDRFTLAVEAMLESRRALLELLMDRHDWQLFFFVFTAPDRLQHLIWEEESVLDHYRSLDAILGQVIEYVDHHGSDLYVLSDHGFGPLESLVYVNHILEQQGYLRRREDDGTRRALARLGLTRDFIKRGLHWMGVSDEFLTSKLPRSLVDRVATQFPGEHALYDVDYGETTAFVHDSGNCYINDTARFASGTVDPRDIEPIKDELTTLFESVTDESDTQLLRVFDGDDLFPTDPESPDLIVNGRDGYETRTALTDEPIGDTGATVASHRSQGIMLCYGPSIEPGAALRGARVVDVAPTVLHGMGRPVPANVDGRVLFDAFRDDARPSRERVEHVDLSRVTADEQVEADFSSVESRLKGLGYME